MCEGHAQVVISYVPIWQDHASIRCPNQRPQEFLSFRFAGAINSSSLARARTAKELVYSMWDSSVIACDLLLLDLPDVRMQPVRWREASLRFRVRHQPQLGSSKATPRRCFKRWRPNMRGDSVRVDFIFGKAPLESWNLADRSELLALEMYCGYFWDAQLSTIRKWNAWKSSYTQRDKDWG